MSPLFAPITDDPSLGGKARSLATLAAAGLTTPAGFVITDALFRRLRTGAPPLPDRLDPTTLPALDAATEALLLAPLPPGFEATLAEELAALGADRFSVRSSFSREDVPGDVAAGIYESRVGVTRADVAGAIRAVLRSALSPSAIAHARAHAIDPEAAPVAVLVHAYVAGQAHGHAAQVGGAPPVIDLRSGTLSAAARAALASALQALTTVQGPIEVEWTSSGDAVTFLQLRPYQPPVPAPAWAGWLDVPPDERDQWRWDAAHNPLPLSPAHAGLVALCDQRCRIGLRQRVLGGYLFFAPGGAAPPQTIAPSEVRAAFDALAAECETHLAALGPEPPLEEALTLFLSAYEPLLGVIQPAARTGRHALEEFRRAHLPEVPASALLAGVESMASERRRRAHDPAAYLALFGDEAPVWDVAEPTFRERPPSTQPALTGRPAAARAGLLDPLPPALRAQGEGLLSVARACASVAEDDDWLYARLQAAVRRAILALGRRLHAAGVLDDAPDLFLWPLALVRAAAAGTLPADARAVTATGRASVQTARRFPPPTASASGGLVRGSGTGGRAVGRVHHHDRTRPGPPDAVLVADTLLPTELPLLQAAALVTAVGGPLDHVATQARERGLPAVVGAAGARDLPDGALVLVDADQGVVVRLTP